MGTPTETAKQWLADNALILDTETTGLGDDAEACEIAVIDTRGEVLFDEIIKPTIPIGRKAMQIHGIRNTDIKKRPGFADHYNRLCELLSGRRIVVFNAAYDEKIMAQSARAHGLEPIAADYECAMLAYAEWYGQKGRRKGEYRWQSLARAALQNDIKQIDPAHRALSDCSTTLEVVRAMATQLSPFERARAEHHLTDEEIEKVRRGEAVTISAEERTRRAEIEEIRKTRGASKAGRPKPFEIPEMPSRVAQKEKQRQQSHVWIWIVVALGVLALLVI